jgi:hypothetical protein
MSAPKDRQRGTASCHQQSITQAFIEFLTTR